MHDDIILKPLAIGERVAYRPQFDGSFDGVVIAVTGSRYRVEWPDSPTAWFDREELLTAKDTGTSV